MSVVVAPAEKFWQGDLFKRVPWAGVQDIAFVTPVGDNRRYTIIQEPAGDSKARMVVAGGMGMAMLVTHECVVDKPHREPLTFARVLPMTIYRTEEQKEPIRNGDQYSAFHLEAVEGIIDESFVDFRYLTSIDRSYLPTLERIGSLTEVGRDSLRVQFTLFWTQHKLRLPIQ